MPVAVLILSVVASYAGAGLLVSIAFVCFAVERVDHGARGAPMAFRIAIIPGCAALWPLILMKWLRSPPPGERP